MDIAKEQLFCELGILEDYDSKRDDVEVLEERLHNIEAAEWESTLKANLIRHLLKYIKKGKEISYEEYLKQWEEIHVAKEEGLLDDDGPRLAPQVVQSLIMLGIMSNPFLLIAKRQWDGLFLSVIFAMIAVLWLFFSWEHFLRDYKDSDETCNQGLKTILVGGLKLIATIAVIIFCFAGIEWIQNKLFVPQDYILYQFDKPYSYFVYIFEIELLLLIFFPYLWKKKQIKSKKKKIFLYGTSILLNVVILYVAVTGVTVCSPAGITVHSFYNLEGTTYSYSDVKQVNAGFKKKGDFYYMLTMKDGTKIQVDDSISNQYEMTYEEYVELDKSVMKYKPVKETSTRYIGNSDLGGEYIKLLKATLKNK